MRRPRRLVYTPLSPVFAHSYKMTKSYSLKSSRAALKRRDEAWPQLSGGER